MIYEYEIKVYDYAAGDKLPQGHKTAMCALYAASLPYVVHLAASGTTFEYADFRDALKYAANQSIQDAALVLFEHDERYHVMEIG